MKTTLNALLAARNTLAAFTNLNINPHLAYKILKFEKLSAEEEAFYNERLRSLFDMYAQKDEEGQFRLTEDGQGILLNQSDIEIFNKSMVELENTEVEAPDIKFALSEITKELNSISVNQLMTLMDFIEEDK